MWTYWSSSGEAVGTGTNPTGGYMQGEEGGRKVGYGAVLRAIALDFECAHV